MAGITNLVLAIAAFTSNLEKDEIKTALESVQKVHVKTWTNKFIEKNVTTKASRILSCSVKKWDEEKTEGFTPHP